jgi:hypothetical protein
MDPSVLLRAYKSPQWPDPIEEYKGFLSLRQMMDLGKLRQVQLKQNELENLQKQRDLDEYEMYRRGVSQLPANATLDQTIQALGPKYGTAHFKLTHEAQTALNQQRAAESAQAEAKLKLGRTQGQSLADMMYANSLLPEKERQADWDTAWGGIPVDLPPTQGEVQAQIARGYGGKEQQAMANAREQRAEQAALFTVDYAKKRADAEKAQNEALTGPPATGALREFNEVFLPSWAAAKGITTPTAKDKFNAYVEFQNIRRPRIEVPGVDVPLSPGVAAQRVQMAKDVAEGKAEGKPPTQGEELLAGYAARVKQANRGFERVTMGTGELAWNRFAPNVLKTEAGQTFAQDERNFINAILRRESGAVISPSEFSEARAQYIPQPGDSEAVLAKKRLNRLLVQQNLIRGAGKAYVDPDQLLREAGVDVPNLNPATNPDPLKVPVKRGPDGKLRD